jgi:hypothetical protein
LVASVTQGTHPLSSDKFKGQVTFTANGRQLPGGSFEVGSPGAVVYRNYKPSGSVTITATVIDSVLYDATDSETISGQSSGISNLQIINEVGNNVTLSWSAYSGASGYTVTKSNGGNCNVSGTTATCNNSPSGTSFTVTANGVSGNPSATITREDD